MATAYGMGRQEPDLGPSQTSTACGNGMRCVAGHGLQRLPLVSADGNGEASPLLDLLAMHAGASPRRCASLVV